MTWGQSLKLHNIIGELLREKAFVKKLKFHISFDSNKNQKHSSRTVKPKADFPISFISAWLETNAQMLLQIENVQ